MRQQTQASNLSQPTQMSSGAGMVARIAEILHHIWCELGNPMLGFARLSISNGLFSKHPVKAGKQF